jgi:hypothetical protein
MCEDLNNYTFYVDIREIISLNMEVIYTVRSVWPVFTLCLIRVIFYIKESN